MYPLALSQTARNQTKRGFGYSNGLVTRASAVEQRGRERKRAQKEEETQEEETQAPGFVATSRAIYGYSNSGGSR